MKGFYIDVTNNLLDKKHRKNMGTSVWEFMWCLDKMTKTDDDEVGWVLGGKPIKLSDINSDLGIAENHISENLTKLEIHGYITTKRTPYGLIIGVHKAKKRYNLKVKENSKKVKSQSEKVSSELLKGQFYIDNTVDKTIDNKTSNVPFDEFWTIYPKKVDKKKSEAKWNKLPITTQRIIIADIPKRKQTSGWKAGYIPNPTTYLNGERWNDEIKTEIKETTAPIYRPIKVDPERTPEEQARVNQKLAIMRKTLSKKLSI